MAWISDTHFDFISDAAVVKFLTAVAEKKADSVLFTGDISNAKCIKKHLGMIADILPQTWCVLGNHDFYHGSFTGVKKLVQEICETRKNVELLGNGEMKMILPHTMIVGVSGWGDGRAGDASKSNALMNDFYLIEDLQGLSPAELFTRLNKLGDESADYVRQVGGLAIKMAPSLIVVTHVPPFHQASLYAGKPCAEDYAPHYVNQAMGHAILELGRLNPRKQILVLAGHTHSRADVQIAPNIRIKVAGASYGAPRIEEILTLGPDPSPEKTPA